MHRSYFSSKLAVAFITLLLVFVLVAAPVLAAGETFYIFRAAWGAVGSSIGHFYYPTGIEAVNGKVYVADTDNDRVQIFNLSGGYEAAITGLTAPRGVTAGADGSIYVADTYGNRVVKYNAALLQDWSTAAWSTVPGTGMRRPSDVALDESRGIAYVSDTYNNRIFLLSLSTGMPIGIWYGPDSAALSSPTGLAVDPAGNLYVADSNRDRIVKYAPNGTILATWGSYGSGEGQFAQPRGLAFLNGSLFVADSGNHRVQEFTAEGVYQSQFGGPGKTAGLLNNPFAVSATIFENRVLIYVADTFNDRVQVFEPAMAPRSLSINPGSVNENAPIGTSAGSFMTVDDNLAENPADFLYELVEIVDADCSGNSAFSLNASGNGLITTAVFDFEDQASYSICARVTDPHGLTFQTPLVIAVNDGYDAPELTDAAFTLAENSPTGTAIGTLTVIDTDLNETFNYTLMSTAELPGSLPAGFSLHPSLANPRLVELRVANQAIFNYEAYPSRQVTVGVRVTDSKNMTATAVVTVSLLDVNEAISAANQTFLAGETVLADTELGTVLWSDLDGADVTFPEFTVTGGDGQDYFSIDSTTGLVKVISNPGFDVAVKNSYTLNLLISDEHPTDPLTGTAVITIQITSQNAPPAITQKPYSVPENSPVDTSVGAVEASDPNTADTLTYAITGGTGQDVFKINSASGMISVANSAALDYEAPGGNTFTLTVTVTDNGSPVKSASATFTITVTNVNEPPRLTVAPLYVDENSPADTIVGIVSAVDPEGHTFTFISDFTGPFWIQTNGTVRVRTGALLDYETQASYTFPVTVVDQLGLAETRNFTIYINNLNEAPALIVTALSVNENTANGTAVGTVTANDPENASLVFTSDDVSGPFLIETNGVIKVRDSAQLNYEVRQTYAFQVTVRDPGGLTDTQSFTITINNLNEAIIVADQTFAARESVLADTLLGTVSWSDLDGAAVTFPKFTVTGGDGQAYFSVHSTSGQVRVISNPGFNIDIKSSYTLNLEVSDEHPTAPLTDTAVITIELDRENSTPVITVKPYSLPENSPVDTEVGAVEASDQDPGDILSYAITGGSGLNVFKINSTSGMISVADSAALDYETVPLHAFSLDVQVSDNGTPQKSTTRTLTITLTNVNEMPVLEDKSFDVVENLWLGGFIGWLTAADPDANPVLTWTIEPGPYSPAISLEKNGALRADLTVLDPGVFNYETHLPDHRFFITVRVTDQGGLTDTALITINLLDQNDPPDLILNPASVTMSEHSDVGTPVAAVSAIDEEGHAVTYAITGGDPYSALTINSASGQITVANKEAFDFERLPVMTVEITATDNGEPQPAQSKVYLTVNLTNINEPPVITTTSLTVYEDSPNGTLVGAISVTDPDAGTVFTYAITGGSGAAVFAIDPVSGVVRVIDQAALKFLTNPTFTLDLLVTDGGAPVLSDQRTITVNVQPLADPAVITFSGPTTGLTGSVLPLQLVIKNLGVGLSGDYTARVTLPDGVSFVSSTGGPCAVVDARRFDCTGSALASLSQQSFNISVRLAGGLADNLPLTFSVALTSDPDIDLTNNNASLTIKTAAQALDVLQDFETKLLPGWWRLNPAGDIPMTYANDTALTPKDSRRFLGQFARDERIAFRMSNLPEHGTIEVSFDLYVIGSWDGVGPSGPDGWRFSMDGATLVSTTFSNHLKDPTRVQDYPKSAGDKTYFPAMTGSAEQLSLGYIFSATPMDSVYHFKFILDHNSPNLELIFASIGLQHMEDEAWGIDNLRIRLTGDRHYFQFLPTIRK